MSEEKFSPDAITFDPSQVPKHVGVVMDGNGRWAAQRGLPRVMGHYEGSKVVDTVVRAAKEFGVSYLSLYTFSSENWKRPRNEILGIFGIVKHMLKKKTETIHAENGRFRFAGRLHELPPDLLDAMHEAEEHTARNTGIQLILCINYGGRQEILDAVNSHLAKLAKGENAGPLTEEAIRGNCYLPDVPDPDLLVRTSGELRMSNFWLWQGAYSEYYFTPKLWPDIGRADLADAIKSYIERERRYGNVRA